MKHVIAVPPKLDARTFDELVQAIVDLPAEGSVLVDTRHLRWADPYGMIGLLAAGRHLAQRGARPALQLPESPEVASYMARMGFQREAEEIFDLYGEGPRRKDAVTHNVLLEITKIRSHEDVHGVIDHVQERAGTILTEKLAYSRGDASMFSMILSEVCQNIIEHAEAGGWVGIQTYNWSRRLGRNVVAIGVMDLGIGFRGSLAKEHAARFGDRWGDAAALEAAFMHGTTRFRDPGRGQGIKQIRSRVHRWEGKVSIRSGTARVADLPDWEPEGETLEEGLPAFPGSQILILLPERVTAPAASTAAGEAKQSHS